ncbi:glycogen debranching protein GlgX [Demequina sp. NBRC 110055]|uniref:glycogen debranching protein GlgX n=1 Tax=Demequina sp. NBRC 110055 TaxID=1570344 RepID=UPI0009FBA5E3|nr:glycogen debranching protein GlgX [Demequina sp. NBRC 110055]
MSIEGVTPSPTPHRLGVHLVDDGAVVGVYAGHATAVELCLFDASGAETRVELFGPKAGVWHAFVPGMAEGQHYGFRAHGPWAPKKGHRYNPAKLLLDPYARGIEGHLTPMNDPRAQALLSNKDDTDTAPLVPRSVVTAEPGGSWQTPRPQIPWEDTVVYELHVKGFTQQMSDVPEHLRGTYAGLAHPASIEYLVSLGITTVELLPVHAFASEPHLENMDLTNYWGYSTMGFFAPHAAYATEDARAKGAQGVLDEFVGMVDLLHQAGLEVILDVVYNHTAEAGWGDRTLSWRGLDNHAYYRHQPHSPGHYDDTTGTGNTLDFSHSRVVQMTLDSLRYWVEEVGVDGFRFDLAATLGRTGHGFSTRHPFLVALTMDPLLGGSKLIAEPWDTGMGGWQVGNFPAPMAEWNDRFRDKVRSFWLGDMAKGARSHPTAPELATRLAGSSDLFGHSEPPLMRGPMASVNFVACHDGFTTYDLTTYNGKHNEANGEDNRDGTDNNRSWNHGFEGETSDADINAMRRRAMRNLLGTTLLSAGTPMLLAGDEIGNTQGGNNNAYCQDNEISWLDWGLHPWQADLRATVQHVVALRRENRVLRPAEFYEGRDPHPDDDNPRADSAWFAASGEPESEDWWEDPATRVLQFMRSLSDRDEPDALLIVNGSNDAATVVTPPDDGPDWEIVWDSAWESPVGVPSEIVKPGEEQVLEPRTLRVLLSRRS